LRRRKEIKQIKPSKENNHQIELYRKQKLSKEPRPPKHSSALCLLCVLEDGECFTEGRKNARVEMTKHSARQSHHR
jgi:hypothetical protein